MLSLCTHSINGMPPKAAAMPSSVAFSNVSPFTRSMRYSSAVRHQPRRPHVTWIAASASHQPLRIITTTAATCILAIASVSPALATISADQCVSGEGSGCEAAAAESPIIRELLEKSRANRAKNDRKLLEDYWARGYGDYFAFGSNKNLVKGEDGKWSLEEFNDLRSQVERKIIEAIRGRQQNQGK